MPPTSTKPLCSRCERFNIQALGKSPYPYQRLALSTAMKSAEQGCSFCSLLVENLASSDLLNPSWLSRMTSALYVQLEAKRDHNMMDIDGGGMAIYQITASIVNLAFRGVWSQLIPLQLHHVDINVSADQGKKPMTRYITSSLCADKIAKPL